MSNSATITPLFTNIKDITDGYDEDFAHLVNQFNYYINEEIQYFTLDEIKEAFAEASKEFEENNN